MSDQPKPEELVDITGLARESLFWEAKSWIVLKAAPGIQADLDATWRHYRDVTDDRLVALVAALCIENSIDELLLSIAPGCHQCKEDQDFTLSVKIKTVRALRVIPARILTACDLVRKVRNGFAHQVTLKRFEDVPDKLREALEPSVRSFNVATRDPREAQRLFKDLVGFILAALRIYTEHVAHLRRFVESDEGQLGFRKWCEEQESGKSTPSI